MSALIENLQRVAAEFNRAATSPEADERLSVSIAEALRWNTDSTGIRSAHLSSSTLKVARGFIGPQAAAVFAVGPGSLNQNLVNEAAFYAYHASIHWGLVATTEGAVVFNSHWLRRKEWFQLPFIDWNEVERNIDIFEAITPNRVKDNHIERLATRVLKPDEILRPVDDALVERLDYWRSETLRYSRTIRNTDENLQTLFAQLFVLRAVEDRNLAPTIPSLQTIYSNNGQVDLDGLSQLLQQAKGVIGSELFEVDTLQHVPENVFCGIIRDLYVPHNLPSPRLRYNFSWIDADVLGLAYEKYLATLLAPVPPLDHQQLSLFEQPLREVERISVRKSGGVYYTPMYLVQYLTESCLNQLNSEISPTHVPQIADFACGSGSFLVAATNSLILRLRQHDPQRNWARELVNGKYIIGIDLDKRAVTMARLSLWLRFAEEPQPLPLPRLEEIIIHGDSLSQEVWASVPTEYDIILGNPPFLATGRTPKREELSARFKSARGKYDYSYLFVELAVTHLKDRGILGIVIPNRLFRNRDANTIRGILTSQTDLVTVVDFGSKEVFEGISAYIGTILAQRNAALSELRAESVRVINVLDLSPNFLSAFLLAASHPGEEVRGRALIAYDSPYPRGSSAWRLISPSERRIRTRLENQSESLETIAGIYQGIRTGANDIFIVEIESGKDSPLVKVINGLGDYDIIESTLLHPVVFGSDIQRYSVIRATRYLIYPYQNRNAIPEIELRESYPRTYEYLSRYRDLLVDRSSITASGLKWYELVRKQDMTWIERPKLLIRDLAAETAFSVDIAGSTYLVGGTAVVPYDSDLLLPLLAYLNSNIVNQYLSQMTPLFRGRFQKFEPQHLQQVPVLRALLENEDLASDLEAEAVRVLEAQNSEDEGERREVEQTIERLLLNAAGIDD